MSSQQLKFIPEKPVNHQKLCEWYDASLNVLLLGEFGVGKTQRILKVFEEKAGNRWAFFNGATTDPWTDLIGIPSVDESSGSKVIKYVKPEELSDSIEGIYIDELNRAKTATRNALLELIQFKSINGRKFPNLKVVWASINPPRNEEDANSFLYDVEELDPAQVDRFHIIVKIPNEPDVAYFTEKHGLRGTNLVDWWKQQGEETKRIISPRRLEYIALLYNAGVDISDALPVNANIKLLKKMIDSAPVINRVNDLFDKRAKAKQDQHAKINEEISALLNNENNFEELKEYIVKNGEWRFLKWLKSEEKIDLMFEQHRDEVLNYFYSTKPENKSRLFKVLNRHLQDDERFQQMVEEANNAYKSDTKSSHIRYVDSDEEATDLIAKYLTDKDNQATYYRRTNLESVLNNMPKTITDSFGKVLLNYLNQYSAKCQVFTLSNSYTQADKEAAKLLVLSKVYTAYAKDRGIDYKDEPFIQVWAKAGVKTL